MCNATTVVYLYIRKICPWNEYTFILYFYIIKLGCTGVYLFFLFLILNSGEAVLTCNHN